MKSRSVSDSIGSRVRQMSRHKNRLCYQEIRRKFNPDACVLGKFYRKWKRIEKNFDKMVTLFYFLLKVFSLFLLLPRSNPFFSNFFTFSYFNLELQKWQYKEGAKGENTHHYNNTVFFIVKHYIYCF